MSAIETNAEPSSTTLSSKGQVVLPQAIRRKRGWEPGTVFEVEETPGGVLLKPRPRRQVKPASLGQPTRLEDVYGCLKYNGSPKTLEDMEAGIEAALRERHDRGRY